MLNIFLTIIPLFIIIFGSAFLVKLKVANVGWQEELNAFALKIGFPALIFSALANMNFSFQDQSGLLIANSIFLVASFVLAYVFGKLLRLKKKTFFTLFICLAFGNVAYLGIPVLTQSLGEEVLPKASLIVAVYLFWMFTIGIGFLEFWSKKTKKDAFKKVLLSLIKNPLLLAVIFGLAFSYLRLGIPSIFQQSLDMLAASVTPVVLVVIGLFLGQAKFGKIKAWIPSFLFALGTLILLPAAFYLVVKTLNYSPSEFSVSIIDAAMPLAITPFALAEEYNLDKNFIARSVVLSTVLSVITLPFWASLF
jgi:predicted permease